MNINVIARSKLIKDPTVLSSQNRSPAAAFEVYGFGSTYSEGCVFSNRYAIDTFTKQN